MVNAFEAYLSDMSEYALLSADEEVALAEQYRQAQAAKARLTGDQDTEPQQRQQLLAAVADGEQARERLIRCNLRLVISQAKRYRGQGLSFEDLVQEGNIGLMEAVERYDPHRGTRFSTYAVPWIRQKMQRAIKNHGRTVRLPAHVSEDLYRLRRSTRELTSCLERQPTPEELALHMSMPVRKVQRLLRWQSKTVSLDAPVGKEQETELMELVADQDVSSIEDAVTLEQMQDEIREMMAKCLRPREQKVLSLRFGLDSGQDKTLAQVAEVLGVTRERVRQIEVRAMRRLRYAGVRDQMFRKAWL
jgi:RNA polymerase sigma factor (sigma-70 family)